MIADVPTEVIPFWYIDKWLDINADTDSALNYWVRKMKRDWKIEEIRMKNED